MFVLMFVPIHFILMFLQENAIIVLKIVLIVQALQIVMYARLDTDCKQMVVF